ncbi:peptidase S8 [Flaviflexus salsibiostraticola]|uniref:Peptidase S8 n=1 Tax=Flaviflexus salsibiostraticola TaxID=1282737 RepID=A0A3S8Z6N7_9ACTO|nr:S8 family serine peptidase [Flaviflexus salsibiostraticola]AZN29145.1 peptidase S8 [Flaviflexus salsibiostraticola]
MTSHVPGRRRLRTCVAFLGVGAVSIGALIAPAAAAPSAEPLIEPDYTPHVGASAAQASVAGSAFGSRATGDWFVEFRSQPIAKGGTQMRVDSELQRLEAAADDLDIDVTSSFSELWSGAVVTADEAELTQLRNDVDVAAVYPVLLVEAPEKLDMGAEPDMAYAKDLTGASLILDETDYSGYGKTIAIIDTGVDIDHPAFGGGGISDGTAWSPVTGNGSGIIGGYDFVGDAFNADPESDGYNPVPAPDDNPDDCNGHGTHVAGIAAGNDPSNEFTGVAPGANLLAYRVFGCDGSTTSEIMLDAMERAAADGADIVNMSIGASFMTWPNYPTAVAADNLVDKGVVVTVSQGNSGDYGVFSGGAPASGKKVISVGSADNWRTEAPALTVSALPEQLIAYSPASGAPLPPQDGTTLEIITYPAGSETGAVPLEGAEGKVVLVRRGDSTFHEKALAAQESGAAGVIIDNNQPGAISATVEGPTPITIPTATISQADGDAIRAALADAETPTVTWTDDTVVSDVATAGLVSDFSSYGLAADLSIKPQVTAPGGLIHSAYPLDAADDDGTGYATISGTSMAAPHVAGAAALLLEATPELTPAQVLTNLQNNATPVEWSLAPGSGFSEPVHRQGAGMINIPRSIVNSWFGTQISPSEINLHDGDTGASETTTLSITNRGESEMVLTPVHDPSPATWGINQYPDFIGAFADVTFSAETVTVPAGSTVTVNATITEPDAPGAIYSGHIYFVDASGEYLVNVVPYAGMAGNYETDVAFMNQWTWADYGWTEDDLGFDPNEPIYPTPTLGFLEECSKLVDDECVSEGLYSWDTDEFVFSMENGDVPYAIIHFENPVSYMKMEAFHATADGTKGAPVSPDYSLVYESHGEGAVPGIQVYPWDGTYRKSAESDQLLNALDGSYILEVTVVKGTGSLSNPDDVEVWTSEAFTIDRDGVPGTGPGDGTIDEEISRGFLLYNDFTPPADHAFTFGRPGDQVFAGDWDGDGVDTLAVRRGNTFFVQNQLLGGNAEIQFNYGRVGDEVLVGDWDGDGKDTFAVRRGTTFYAQNSLQGGNAENQFNYGRLGDQVYAGDWDGDAKDTFAVRRGNAFYVRNTLTGGYATTTFNYGRVGDEVLVGDWDGDGKDTITVRRGTTFYVANSLISGSAQKSYTLGRASDQVIVGDWNADSIDSIGLRR